MYVSQIIMLYTLNLYSTVCQLYLNKARRKQRIIDKETNKKQGYILHCWEKKKRKQNEKYKSQQV